MRPLIVSVLLIAAGAAEEAAPRPLHLKDAVALSAAVAAVDLAKLEAAIAHANLGAQRWALRPNIQATAGAARSTIYFPIGDQASRLPPENILDARLRLGQALFDLNAWNLTEAAERRLAAATAGTILALEESAGTAAAAYVAVIRAQALAAVRRGDLALANDLLTLARAQVEAGAAEGLAATRAEARSAEPPPALPAPDGAVRQATITLARALDLDPGAAIAPADALDEALGASEAPEATAAALDQAQQRRAELRVSAETLAALTAQMRAARGARLPKLDGFADAGRIGTAFDDTVTTWEIGVALSIPLFDRSADDEEAARHRAAQEQRRRDDLGRAVAAQVRSALVGIETGRAVLVSAREQRRLSEQEVSEARTRFAAGAAGNLDLITAQVGLARANELVVSAQEAVVLARVQLAKAVGAATTLR